jgi:hypothetical protein
MVDENLFLRRQVACYLERGARSHRADNASRIALVFLSRFVAWRDLLTIVQPDTFVRGHRHSFRLFWLSNRLDGATPARPCTISPRLSKRFDLFP